MQVQRYGGKSISVEEGILYVGAKGLGLGHIVNSVSGVYSGARRGETVKDREM